MPRAVISPQRGLVGGLGVGTLPSTQSVIETQRVLEIDDPRYRVIKTSSSMHNCSTETTVTASGLIDNSTNAPRRDYPALDIFPDAHAAVRFFIPISCTLLARRNYVTSLAVSGQVSVEKTESGEERGAVSPYHRCPSSSRTLPAPAGAMSATHKMRTMARAGVAVPPAMLRGVLPPNTIALSASSAGPPRPVLSPKTKLATPERARGARAHIDDNLRNLPASTLSVEKKRCQSRRASTVDGDGNAVLDDTPDFILTTLPSHLDQPAILAALEADRVRVAELQTLIARLERALAQLRLEPGKPQGRLDAYRYPVLTLPNEIVSEVFMHVVPPYPNFPDLIGPYSRFGAPLRCSVIAHIFELWLNRSRHCPLSIDLGTDLDWGDGLVESLLPHRARWQYLKLDVEAENLRPMPLLRNLELLVKPGPFYNGAVTGITRRGMPLLHTLVLNAPAAFQLTFPWAQLTSLTLIRLCPSECASILVQTQILVHCKLEVRREGLSSSNGGHSKDFLQKFIVPGLRSLEIPESFLQPPNPMESLSAFAAKCGCKLEELHLIVETSVPESESYRKAFPSLRKLSVERSGNVIIIFSDH
ncbi:hypothetical protein C8R47DRAFT_1227415 [Mycena vitilis]|nr:hypothetical protein C8R47DRAFT_1227415 [Mycena vitilis]